MGESARVVRIRSLWKEIHSHTKHSYTEAVKHDVANLRRYALVNKMKEVAKEEDNQVLNRWCVQQEGIVLRSLKKVDHDQIEWLITLAKERGGMFLQATCVPHSLPKSNPSSFAPQNNASARHSIPRAKFLDALCYSTYRREGQHTTVLP